MSIYNSQQLISASNATYFTNTSGSITAADVRGLNDNWISSSALLSGSNSFVGNQTISGSLTAQLPANYIWLGNSSGYSQAVATSSISLQGAQGIQGLQGTQGTQGISGSNGAQGVSGSQGITGAQGITGSQGIQGIQGVSGQFVQGSQGASGGQGGAGQQGTQGAQGISGSNGTQGTDGTQGATGQLGTQGIQGGQGFTGGAGQNGTQGAQGATGTGTQGATGAQGSTGNSNAFFNYQAKDNITSGDPLSGHIIWNNATQASATSISVSDTDQNSNNIDVFLSNIEVGTTIVLQDQSSQSNYQKWEITSRTDNTTYWTYGVTLITSTYTFPNNHQMLFVISAGVQGAQGAQGTTGQSITGAQGANGAQGSTGAAAQLVINNNNNNNILTATGTSTLQGENNLTFDGSLLNVAGNVNVVGNQTITGSTILKNTSTTGTPLTIQSSNTDDYLALKLIGGGIFISSSEYGTSNVSGIDLLGYYNLGGNGLNVADAANDQFAAIGKGGIQVGYNNTGNTNTWQNNADGLSNFAAPSPSGSGTFIVGYDVDYNTWGLIQFQSTANWTDGRTTFLTPISAKSGSIITGSLNVSGSSTFNGNQTITGSLTISSSAFTDLTVISKMVISGPAISGQAPSLIITGSDGGFTTIGRSFNNINTAQVNGVSDASGQIFANTSSVAGMYVGVYDDPNFNTDVELNIIVTKDGSSFSDFDNGTTFSSVPFMTLTPNTGNNPIPIMTRGLGISGSLYVSGNIYAANLTGSGGTINTGSFITTGSASTARQAISGGFQFNTTYISAPITEQSQGGGSNIFYLDYNDVFCGYGNCNTINYWLATGNYGSMPGVIVNGTGVTNATVTAVSFGTYLELTLSSGTVTNLANYTFTGPLVQDIGITGSLSATENISVVNVSATSSATLDASGVGASNATFSAGVNAGIIQIRPVNNNDIFQFAASSSAMYNGGGTWPGPQIAGYRNDINGDASIIGFQTGTTWTDGTVTILTPLVAQSGSVITGSLSVLGNTTMSGTLSVSGTVKAWGSGYDFQYGTYDTDFLGGAFNLAADKSFSRLEMGGNTSTTIEMFANGGNYDTFRFGVDSSNNGTVFQDYPDATAYETWMQVGTSTTGNFGEVSLYRNTNISGNLDIQSTFTASLANGYTYVGDSNNRTTLVATSSFSGPQGAQGVAGQFVQGSQGASGAQGATTQGVQGTTGTQGADGQAIQGATGQSITGPQGIQGIQGASGTGGQQGAQGATGGQGTQGATGTNGYGYQGLNTTASLTLQTGTVTFTTNTNVTSNAFQTGNRIRLAYQSNPSLYWEEGVITAYTTNQMTVLIDLVNVSGGTYSGFDIGITGQQGNIGLQGIQGTAGQAGATGGQGIQGNTGAGGQQGTQGATGAGTQGATGANGTNGTNGTNGSQGAAGGTGAQGSAGGSGPQGSTGGTGAQGSAGSNGSNGSQGATGATGAQGATGATGSGFSTISPAYNNALVISNASSNSAFTNSSIYVSGNTIYADAFYQNSSRLLKTNIIAFDDDAIALLKRVSVVTFYYKNDTFTPHIGFIAEDTPQELSGINQNMMDVPSVVGTLIKAVQQLQAQNDSLVARIEALENR